MANAFSLEDKNLDVSTILTSRTRAYKDIDLTFKNIPISLEGKINKKLKLILISYARLSGLKSIILSEKSIINEPSSWIKSFMDEKT